VRRATLAAIGVSIAALYLLRLDHAAGLYVDDAWYIVLAESLWTGHGFRLISSAAAPILPAVPPGFPLILAPIVGLTPHFPDNVFALKAVSIVAMFGVGIGSYRYVARYYGSPPMVAAVVAVVTVTLPAFVFLATSTVMAEAVFTLSQLLLILMIERAAANGSGRSTAVAGLIGGITLLIRLAAVAGVAGGALYLAWRRGAKAGLAFSGIVCVCYAPWAWYSMANASTAAERAAHGGSMAAQYSELLLMRRGGEPSSGQVRLAELPQRIAKNAAELFALDSGGFIIPAAYRSAVESGEEAMQLSRETGMRASGMGDSGATVWLASAISLIMLAGFISSLRQRLTVAEVTVVFTIAMVLLVPARTFRYVLPLAPFVIFYFFRGIGVIVTRGRSSDFGAAFRISAACVLAMFAIEHTEYIVAMRAGPPPPWLRDYAEVKAETDWMRQNLRRDGPVAASNPGLVYLTTGRRTLALTNSSKSWLDLQKAGVPYGAALRMTDGPAIGHDFHVIYESPRLRLWVVEIPAQPAAALTETDSGR
jgi:hypothetical protein